MLGGLCRMGNGLESPFSFTPLRGYGRTRFPTRLFSHARPAVQDVKRTGKSVLLYTTPRVRENGFSYPFALLCSAGFSGCETDWKVRSPLHHSEGTGERVFLPVCFIMLGGLSRMCNGLESPFSFTPLRWYGRTGFPTRLFSYARLAVQDVQRTGKSVLLYITSRVRENGVSYPFAFPCSAGCAGWETDWKVRSPFYTTSRVRKNGFSYPFASSCSAGCAGRETDWKVRSPFCITSRIRENSFSYPFVFLCAASCAGCETDWKVRSPLYHFEGTGERVFLPVCSIMLGRLCRM